MKKKATVFLAAAVIPLTPVIAGAETRLSIRNGSQTIVDFYHSVVTPELEALSKLVDDAYKGFDEYAK